MSWRCGMSSAQLQRTRVCPVFTSELLQAHRHQGGHGVGVRIPQPLFELRKQANDYFHLDSSSRDDNITHGDGSFSYVLCYKTQVVSRYVSSALPEVPKGEGAG